MDNNRFLTWYNDNYSRGDVVASLHSSEIANVAEEIGVNWNAVSDRVSWRKGRDGKVNAYGSQLLKGFKNSVGIYASIERCTKTGVEFPLITFKNKGGAGDTVVFNGLQLLWDLFKEHINSPISASEQLRRKNEKQAKLEKAERKQKAALLKQQEEDKRRAANVQTELANHYQLPCAASLKIIK